MSGRLTVILGLCGSGKSELINRLDVDLKFDEGFAWNHHGEYQQLITALRAGRHCAVIEVEYCLSKPREAFVAAVRRDAPDATIDWKCFANNLAQANKNCATRKDGRDTQMLFRINQRLSSGYTFPDNAEILQVWTSAEP